MSPEYRNYLMSDEWIKKRAKVLKRDRGICRVCKAKTKLHVHHITYKRVKTVQGKIVANERLSDLITLCEYHHRLIHKRYTMKERMILSLAKTAFLLVLLGTITVIYWRIK